jgi:hypothetical protein
MKIDFDAVQAANEARRDALGNLAASVNLVPDLIAHLRNIVEDLDSIATDYEAVVSQRADQFLPPDARLVMAKLRDHISHIDGVIDDSLFGLQNLIPDPDRLVWDKTPKMPSELADTDRVRVWFEAGAHFDEQADFVTWGSVIAYKKLPPKTA